MRVLDKKQKRLVSVKVPQAFREFLGEVTEMIREGRDEAIIESDDLLQCEEAYGGLIEEGGAEYGFTYFPKDGVECSWDVALDVSKIEAIAEGRMQHLDLWECSTASCGSKFSCDSEACLKCDYLEISPIFPSEAISEKMEWGREFFKLNPRAEGFHIREVLQQDPKLSTRWGDFSNDEIDELK